MTKIIRLKLNSATKCFGYCSHFFHCKTVSLFKWTNLLSMTKSLHFFGLALITFVFTTSIWSVPTSFFILHKVKIYRFFCTTVTSLALMLNASCFVILRVTLTNHLIAIISWSHNWYFYWPAAFFQEVSSILFKYIHDNLPREVIFGTLCRRNWWSCNQNCILE